MTKKNEEKESKFELLAKKKTAAEGKKSRDMRKKYKDRLPNELIHIPNPDKSDHEKWHSKRNIAAFPRPFRAILAGGVNAGKTNTAKNITIKSILITSIYLRFKKKGSFSSTL